MYTIQMLKIPILILALVLVSSQYVPASAEPSSKSIKAAGNVVSFNNAPHSGLWAAEASVDSNMGDLVSVFKNDAGDIFIVTVKGDHFMIDEQGLTISGTGFVAKNNVLLKQGNGTARISESSMEIRVNGDVVVSGQTLSFETK